MELQAWFWYDRYTVKEAKSEYEKIGAATNGGMQNSPPDDRRGAKWVPTVSSWEHWCFPYTY